MGPLARSASAERRRAERKRAKANPDVRRFFTDARSKGDVYLSVIT
jgi:hypothetical protein